MRREGAASVAMEGEGPSRPRVWTLECGDERTKGAKENVERVRGQAVICFYQSTELG
jgi:hypothetical protein